MCQLNVQFTCPDCERNCRIEEIMTDVIQVSPITFYHEDEIAVELEYADASTEAGFVERYQCEYCGFKIKNENDELITDQVELIKWLRSHNMIKERYDD